MSADGARPAGAESTRGPESGGGGGGLRTVVDKDSGVAVLTLDRPHRLNAIDLGTAAGLTAAWRALRYDDTVRAVVVTGSGTRAFCTGIDRDAEVPQPSSPYMVDDPLATIGPKANDLWKPVIAAVNGMACGGAFYLIGEAEFVVADEEASFFDPHTTYGMVSAYESVYLAQRMPFGEVARMALMGTAERISARRAYEVGLVSELTPPGGALAAAVACATVIASYPADAVQGTVRALWQAQEATRAAALAHAPQLVSLGNLPGDRQAELFAGRRPGGFRTR
ncbi:enoyl-CoA hydratase/isomerase family protein [Streptomyces sp. NPDC005529]|uniref:enoyl-CoA hydratase/isomerase family protein n=1 Tax=unclassified Streptomyces TaxID=2593676 RepID=UPI0033B9AD2E